MNDAEIQPKMSILIVEEEVDVALLKKAYFLRKNYEVIIAQTFSDALLSARDHQPAYIFLATPTGMSDKTAIEKLRVAAPHAQIHLSRDFHPGSDL